MRYGWVALAVVFFVGAWATTKWPAVNVIGKVTG